MQIFKSKIDKSIAVFLFVSLLACFILTIYAQQIPAVIIMMLVLVFCIDLYRNTKYIIDNECLKIKSGILVKKTIEIEKINKISISSSLMSAPALSLDRIEITYNKFDSIVISPSDKELLIAELQKINPLIVFKN